MSHFEDHSSQLANTQALHTFWNKYKIFLWSVEENKNPQET